MLLNKIKCVLDIYSNIFREYKLECEYLFIYILIWYKLECDYLYTVYIHVGYNQSL